MLCTLLNLYFFVLFARAILSWIPISGDGFLAQVNSILMLLTEPVLRPVRRAMGPVRVGGVGLDLSFLVVVIAFRVLMAAIGC